MPKPKLFKLTAWYGLSIVFTRAINFILLPIYSNFLSTEEFGIYALVLTVYSFSAVLFQFGLQNGLTKYFIEAEKHDRKKQVFSTALNFIVILSIGLTFTGVIFSEAISGALLNSEDYSNLIILIFLILPIETLAYFALHLAKVLERSRFVAVVTAIAAVVNFAANILFIVILNLGIEGIFYAQLLAAAVMLLGACAPAIKYWVPIFDGNYLRRLIKFSLPIFAGGLLAVLIDYSDRFFIDRFLSRADVGIYALSYRIAFVMNVFVIAFRTAWTPRSLNEINAGNYSVHFGKVFEKLIAVFAVVFIFVSVLAPYAFKIQIGGNYLLNPAFSAGAAIIPFVLIGYAFSGLSSFYSVYPYSSGKSYHFLIFEIIGVIVNVVLNILFIPRWGISGAAFATLLSFAAGSFYLVLVSKRKISIKYPAGKIVFILIATAAAYFIAGLTQSLWLHLAVLVLFTGFILLKYRAGIWPVKS